MNIRKSMETNTETSGALDALRRRGLRADGFSEGYEARAAIMAVAKEIRRMRLNAGLTQTQLAQRAGMSQPEISRIEAGVGRQGPSVDTLNRLAMACNQRLIVSTQAVPAPPNAETQREQASLAFGEQGGLAVSASAEEMPSL